MWNQPISTVNIRAKIKGGQHANSNKLIPDIGCLRKMHLTLMLYFEAVTTIVSGLLRFSVSPDLYNSFDTLLISFHDFMNK